MHLEQEEEEQKQPVNNLIKKNPTLDLNDGLDEMNSDSLSDIRDEEAITEHLQEPRFAKRMRAATDQASPKMS